MTPAAQRFDELEAEIARRAELKRQGEDVSIRDLLPELRTAFFMMTNEEAEERAERLARRRAGLGA